jgi:probable F420-dependent oxidoreductase
MRATDTPEKVAELARLAEQLGYTDYWTSDHIGHEDPFISLMVAAAAAPSLRVGPLVLNNELHHPALLARTAASVDQMTNGRLILGIGTGYDQSEHDSIGVTLRPPGPRVTRLEQSVQVLRSLLDTGTCQLDTEHHHIDVDDLGINRVQKRVPILIGGNGRRVVSIAGRHADIFQFMGMSHDKSGGLSAAAFARDDVAQRRAWLEQAAGDRIGSIELSALVQIAEIGDGAAAKRAEAAERTKLSTEIIDETPYVLVGSKEQIIDKLERQRQQVGISHYVVRELESFAPIVEALAGR